MGLRYRGKNVQEVYAQRNALLEAAKAVIANWSEGDLAGAVNQLEEALARDSEPTKEEA